MRRRAVLLSILLLGLSSLLYLSDYPDGVVFVPDEGFKHLASSRNSVIQEDDDLSLRLPDRSVGVLIPGWEVLVIAPPSLSFVGGDDLSCLFQRNLSTPASFSGVIPSSNRSTFKCLLPERLRRRQPFLQPLLTQSPLQDDFHEPSAPPLLRWKFLAYESLSTPDDVVVFVKGINHRAGVNRSPAEFNCVFGDGLWRTAVTSSAQEVFRCPHPPHHLNEPLGVSIEIKEENVVVPSVAYYTRSSRSRSRSIDSDPESLVCASTMVYNVGKFVKEWVMYHWSIGVERFILYDNGSEDRLGEVVGELKRGGYRVEVVQWVWPKTQEAGFSHSALYARGRCQWVLYADVDEFVYSPDWADASAPSREMLPSLIRAQEDDVGQVSMGCYEFGPSGQTRHPEEGVTQGYTCRRRGEQRHKSVVRVGAVDGSLENVIHHFRMREGERTAKTSRALVNHYKYQAWPEFRNKFRRRVSAYVADWTDAANAHSKDRTPGLGVHPEQPHAWPQNFCDVNDNRLKDLSRRWFARNTSFGYRMAWQ